jgi:hypothetical protein
VGEKVERPGRCGLLALAHPPGRLSWDISTTGRPVGVNLHVVQSHRPSRLAARRAMPIFVPTRLPEPDRCHRFTLTRLPEPSVLVPIGTDLLRPVGVAPDLRLRTTAPLPAVACEPGDLPTAPGEPDAPVDLRCRRLPVDPV